MNGLLFIISMIILVYLTVKNNWFYDRTSPDCPKKTKTGNWFLSKGKRRN